MSRVLVRLVIDTLLVATALFAGAGTLSWPPAWVMLAAMLVVRSASASAVYRINPQLIRERSKRPIHRDQPVSDKVFLLAVVGTGFVGLPFVAGLDVFDWQVLPPPAPLITAAGIMAFTLGWTLKAFALRANAFATSVVRVQREREHAVIDTGAYRVVRHPFYAGTVLVLTGMGLWLGSYLAALSSIVPLTLLIARLRLEERFLRRELPGYTAYADRVPHRLIPGVW